VICRFTSREGREKLRKKEVRSKGKARVKMGGRE
jgi:hypothetical protein